MAREGLLLDGARVAAARPLDGTRRSLHDGTRRLLMARAASSVLLHYPLNDVRCLLMVRAASSMPARYRVQEAQVSTLPSHCHEPPARRQLK